MPQLSVVHSEPLSTEYRAPFCSSANLWRLFTYPAIFGCTLLLAFATQGFWRRTNTYVEQPIIDFRERLFFVFTDVQGSITAFWTPFEQMNLEWPERLAMPAIATNLRDLDGDWRPDEVTIRITFRPFAQTNGTSSIGLFGNFTSIFYALFFDVRLEKRAWIEMNSAPIIGQAQKTAASANALNVIGSLDFVQMRPLPSFGNLTVREWNPAGTVQNGTDSGEGRKNLEQFMDRFCWDLQRHDADRNFTIGLGRKAEHWQRQIPSSNQNQSNFHFTFRARIREQVLHYRTNGWEMLKWAWVQWLACFVLLRAFFNTISNFLYENQILGTFIVQPSGHGEKKAD